MPDREAPNGLPYTSDLSFQSGDLVFATDRRGRIVYWNRECERLLGRPSSETLGHSFDMVCKREPGSHSIDIPAIVSGRDFAGDVRCLNRAGAEVALYLFATVGRNKAGEPAGAVFVGRDVTGLWHAEEIARSSLDKYRLLFENTTDSVAIANVEGRVFEANAACLRMYGYSADEVGQMNLIDVVAPESREDAAAAMAELSAGKAVTKTLRMIRKDGSGIVVDLVANVISVGGEQRVFSVTRDVTARALVEEATKASARKYEAIFASVADAVFLETLDGRILEVNDNACRLLGYSREELLALKVTDLVPPDARAWLPRINDIIIRDGSFRAEAVNVRKDGSLVPVEINAAALQLDQQTMVILIARDISERKEAEAKLRASEDRYRTIFEATGTAMLVLEEDTTVAMINREFEAIFGYSREEVVGRSWTPLVHAGDRDRMLGYHRTRRQDGRPAPRSYEARILHKSGQERQCLLTVEMIPGGRRSIVSIIDVTERKRAEADLVASKERYRELFNNSPIGIYRTTPGGEITMANPALIGMLGYQSYTELAARNLDTDGFSPSYPRSRFKERLEHDGQIVGLEAEWVTKEGKTIYVRENARAVRDVEGRIAYYEGTVENVTERKATEAALAASEERYRHLFNNSPVGMYRTTPAGEIKMANTTLVRMLGYESYAELAMRNLEREWFTPNYSRAEFKERLEREGEIVGLEGTRVKRDGSTIYVRENARVVRDSDGRAVYYEGTEEDITERKLAEAALRESEQNFRAMAENSIDGFAVADAAGRYIYVNARFAEISGYAADQLLKMTFHDLLPPDEARRLNERYTRRMRGEQTPSQYELTAVRADGRLVPLEVTVARTTWHGRPASFTSLRDISARRAAEHALQESERQYHTALDAMHDPVHVADADLRIVMVNQAFLRWLAAQGIDNSVQGKTVFEAFPFLPAKVKDEYRRVVETGQPLVTEEKTTVGDQAYFTETTKVPVVENDKVVRILTVVRDITERQRAEQALRDSEERLRTLRDNVPVGLFRTTPAGTFESLNPAAVRMFGYASEPEMLELRVTDLYAEPADRAMMVERLTRDGRIVNAELKVRRRDGSLFPGLLNVETIIGADGRPLHFDGTIQDVSERQQADDRLRASEGRFRVLFEQSPVAVAISRDDIVVYVNPAHARLFGYASPDEMIGLSVSAQVAPASRAESAERMRRLAAGHTVSSPNEITLLRKDGSEFHALAGISHIDLPDGGATVASFVDLTGRKESERTLRESEARYRTLAETSPDAVVMLDTATRMVYVSPRMVALHGYESEAELLGRPAPELVLPEDRPKAQAQMGVAVERGSAQGIELRMVRRDGSVFDAELSAAVVKNSDGRVATIICVARDVSERKRVETMLRESEENFRAMAENASDAVFIYTEGGRFVYCNARGVELTGYPLERLRTVTMTDILRPEDVEIIRGRVMRRLRGEEPPARYELSIIRSDGRVVPVELTANRTVWRGQPAGILFIHDITERKVAEQALAASEARYRNLVDSIRDGVFTLDRYGRFMFVNDTLVNRSGRPREWWLGRDYAAVVLPESREVVKTAFDAVMRGARVPPYEAAFAAASGELVYVQLSVAPLMEGGRVTGLLGISRDITRRKVVEQKTRETQEQYKRLVELSPDGIAVHQDGKIVMVNLSGARVLGYESPEDMVGKPVLDVVHPDDRAKVIARIGRVMESGRPGELVEERFVRKDGSLVPVEVVNSPFLWQGRPAVQVVVRDISDRKRLTTAVESTADQLHAVLSNSPEAVAAECEGSLVFANQRFAQLFGYDSPEQVIGRPAGDFDAPDDRTMLVEYSGMRERGEDAPTRYSFRGLKRDGTTAQMQAVISTYRSLGKFHILAFIREIEFGRNAD